MISREESYERVATVYKGWSAYYFLDYDGDEVSRLESRESTSTANTF